MVGPLGQGTQQGLLLLLEAQPGHLLRGPVQAVVGLLQPASALLIEVGIVQELSSVDEAVSRT